MSVPIKSSLRWHSNDFLVRIERGESPDDESTPLRDATPVVVDPNNARTASPFALSFDSPSLATVSADPDLHEHRSLLRSTTLSTPHLINFAARNKSVWALDVLAGRLTRDRHDWASLRATVLRFSQAPRSFEPTLDPIGLEDLYSLVTLLHERAFDPDAERGLLQFIAQRVLRGGELTETGLESLIESLLVAGLGDESAALFPRLGEETWLRYAIAAELQHPRFDGSYEALLAGLNEAYFRFGLERLQLSGPGETPFDQLDATAASRARSGPLVTVIMTSDRPGPELRTAARSVVAQSYQDWELIVIDDASPSEHGQVLDEVAALDPRIRVIRNETGAGAYVRRNEAIQLARGEFVTLQDAHGWSHPRRLELQVRDLLAVPARLANLVQGARVTGDLSLFPSLGAELIMVESSILFRREAVVGTIGYFDTTDEGADVEFRQRLENATRTRIQAVEADVPMEFLKTDPKLDHGEPAGRYVWTHPELMAYRSSVHRFHERIRAGRQEAYVGFPQEQRIITAPPRLLGIRPQVQQVDLLVVVDALRPSWRERFIDVVVDELQTAVKAGLRVALLNSESATGVLNIGPLPNSLESMIDSGQLIQVFDDDPVEATVVVVRHAGAAQGHPARRRPVTTSRAVVVEDRSGGDERGVTVSQPDVRATVEAWFGVEPDWIVVRPTPSKPNVKSVVIEDGTVSVRLQSPELASISAVRIGTPSAYVDLDLTTGLDAGGRYMLAVGPADKLPSGDLSIVSARQADGEPPALQTCPVPPKTVLTVPGERLLVSTGENGGLRLLPAASDPESIGAADFSRRYLDAEVSLVRVFRDLIGVTVTGAGVEGLIGIYALRVANGRMRRREFIMEPAIGGRVQARHSLGTIVDVRWQVYGRFQTPLGQIEAPIRITGQTAVDSDERFRVRLLADRGVLQVVPQRVEESTRVPGLSVVMPVYNVGPYLDTAIKSVLTQDFEDLELIIIDDASSDNGRAIIEMHRALDPRVRVIELDHNTLGGAGIPSNLGIRAARGKYLAFVDSDDWVSKTGFTQLVALAEQHDAEVAIGDFLLFLDDDRSLESPADGAAWLDLPLEEPISAVSHPSLLRLSPVPWRKVYRRDFVEANRVRFPEGDFFYEDNALHWLVLSRAQRVVASDDIVAYHRMAREGQTMGADQYRLAAISSHANTIANALDEIDDDSRDTLYEAFIEYLRRQNWTVTRQTQPAAAALLKHRYATIYQKAITAAPHTAVRDEVRRHFEEFREAAPDLDLTVVIPVYNSEDLIAETLDSVLELSGLGLRYNVLLVDDGSTDASLEVLRNYEEAYEQVHVFTQKNRGAGRARNSVIPLVTGRYAYFLDADDVIDAEGLTRAVAHADREAADLVFTRYRIEYVDEERTRGMFNADTEIWDRIRETDDEAERLRLTVGLINYPWNRIIRTSVLHDANIFFGPTVVHNDVLFHWHSILSAHRVSFVDADVCTHRKFETRAQVTNIGDRRRLAVVDSLRGTYDRISELERYPSIHEEWFRFAVELLEWARDRIPAELQKTYTERGERFIQAVFEHAAGLDLPISEAYDGLEQSRADGSSSQRLSVLN